MEKKNWNKTICFELIKRRFVHKYIIQRKACEPCEPVQIIVQEFSWPCRFDSIQTSFFLK